MYCQQKNFIFGEKCGYEQPDSQISTSGESKESGILETLGLKHWIKPLTFYCTNMQAYIKGKCYGNITVPLLILNNPLKCSYSNGVDNWTMPIQHHILFFQLFLKSSGACPKKNYPLLSLKQILFYTRSDLSFFQPTRITGTSCWSIIEFKRIMPMLNVNPTTINVSTNVRKEWKTNAYLLVCVFGLFSSE